jgi:hypothetical protein
MADPQRDAFLRKMIAEGTSDDDILATLKVYDAKHALPTRPVSAEDFMKPSATDQALSQVKDVGIGALKGLGSSASGLANMAQRAGAMGIPTSGFQHPIFDKIDPALVPTNTPQKIGRYAEMAAELAPGAIGLGKAAMSAAPQLGGAAMEVGSHLPVVGRPIRLLRALGRMLPQEAAADAPAVGGAAAEAIPAAMTQAGPAPSLPNFHAPTAAPPMAAAQAPPSSLIPSLADLKPTVREIPPGDMPRSWHAFMDDSSRAAANPDELRQATALHKELAQMDAAYRGKTAAERLAMQQAPQSYRDAILSFLSR